MTMKFTITIIVLALIPFFVQQSVNAQLRAKVTTVASPKSAAFNRERGLKMLKTIKSELKGRYYDKNLRGIDIDTKYKEARDTIKKLKLNWQIFRVIAQFVMQFDDSHTKFYPPGRANRIEYGFTTQMIGNVCYIVDVKEGSDAAKKGLKVGDVVVGIDRYNPNRENLWKINYILYALDPLQKINVFVLDENKKEKRIEVEASTKSIKERRKEYLRRRGREKRSPFTCREVNKVIIACRLESFVVTKSIINDMMKAISGHQKLVLDLRGNGGGYVHIEEYLVGHFFDRDLKIADFVTRKKTKERIAKSQGDAVFKGDLAVLVDSESGSAAEVFARVIQLEKRGKVIGDVTAGAVMTSIQMPLTVKRGPEGLSSFTPYSLQITVADLIMSDGKRLEKVGVIPDIPVGPSGEALAQGNDPVLAYAVSLFGQKMTSEEAGQFEFLFPPEEGDKKKEDSEEGETP